MDKTENTQQPRGSSLKLCKWKPCGILFRPKRVDQVFHAPNCKTSYTMDAYEKGIAVMNRKGMHAARLENSVPLQKLLAHLLDGQEHTTADIGQTTGIEAVGSRVGELRRNGFTIKCFYDKGLRAYAYKLIGRTL